MGVNSVKFGSKTIIDITDSTVTPETLTKGVIAYDKKGDKIVGEMEAVIEPLNVTKNGTYTAPTGVDGYSPVSVNVPVPDGYIKPSRTLSITKNGSHDVTQYATASVNVPVGVTVQIKTGTVTGVSGSAKTVSVGFKPDAVFFTGTNPIMNNAMTHSGAAFTAANVTSVDLLFTPPSSSYVFSGFTVAQTSSGFTVKGIRVNPSLQMSSESNRSINWTAVKYT